ncbi:MAG: OmpA family protein [Prevotellaceae bacterium]|nr:OmpA family protein [Prevotellaceae bacterium]
MKKLLVVVALSVFVFTAGAQTQQYRLTQIETGTDGDDWGAIPGPNGEIIFTNTGFINAKNYSGDVVTRLIVLDANKKLQALFPEDEYQKSYLGAPFLSKDGNELFYAVSGDKAIVINKGFFLSSEVSYPLQIQSRTKGSGGSWGEPVDFPYNSDSFSSGDPWLGDDGFLYFASDRPGGLGGLDLWRSKRVGDTWSEPENLGPEINSDADERSPRFDKQGNFYYSSNYISMGGLDVFKAAVVNGQFSAPARISPFNSKGDDFAVTFISERTGYISSNRGGGADRIYYFEIPESPERKTSVRVQDKTGLPIEGALVTYVNNEDVKTVATDATGEAVAYLPEKLYDLNISKLEYIPLEAKEKLPSVYNGSVLTLEKIGQRLVDEEKTAAGPHINVLFDLAKYNIRPDAAKEIDNLLAYLKDNPTLNIEVSGHTDCRGSYSYNLKLSQNRADAVKAYLVNKGIDAGRISTKGNAYAQLVNNCVCAPGVTCTEQEHAPNRYVTYVVVK